MSRMLVKSQAKYCIRIFLSIKVNSILLILGQHLKYFHHIKTSLLNIKDEKLNYQLLCNSSISKSRHTYIAKDSLLASK